MAKTFTFLALALLTLANPVPRDSPFHKLSPIPGKAAIVNRCNYPVYVAPTYAGNSVPSPPPALIPTGQIWSQNFQKLPQGGVSLKISNPNVAGPITQFEYTAEDSDQVWYNLSFLDCVKGAEGKDAKSCPGWELGVQAVCGSGNAFQCKPGEYCDQSGYFIPENGNKPQSPVKQCKKSEGVTFELCATA